MTELKETGKRTTKYMVYSIFRNGPNDIFDLNDILKNLELRGRKISRVHASDLVQELIDRRFIKRTAFRGIYKLNEEVSP